MFERFPDELQQQALLGIHLDRLARRDAEEAGVKAPDVVKLSGRPGIGLARSALRRVLEARQWPTVVGNGCNGTFAVFQK